MWSMDAGGDGGPTSNGLTGTAPYPEPRFQKFQRVPGVPTASFCCGSKGFLVTRPPLRRDLRRGFNSRRLHYSSTEFAACLQEPNRRIERGRAEMHVPLRRGQVRMSGEFLDGPLRSRHLRGKSFGFSSVPERLMLAFNVNDCGARDAEWPMGEQVQHLFGQELCRFDIECQEALLHGAAILYESEARRLFR